MRRYIIFLACLALGACGFTSQGDLARDTFKQKGAQAMDEGLNNALWFMCYGASHGSVERRFGTSADLATAYNTLCGRIGNTTIQPG